MVTRRALLGAGALLFVGCGPPDEPEIVPKDVLEQQMKAATASVQALVNVDAPKLRANAEARVRLIGAAYERAGGGGEPVMLAPPDPYQPLEALRLELISHVQAVGKLGQPEYRELFAEVIASAAADESALLMLDGQRPAPSAFPGTP